MEINLLIKKINALAKKQRSIGLTNEEKTLQTQYRKLYIDYIKAQLVPQLENIKIVDENDPEYIRYKNKKKCDCDCNCEH